MTMPETKPCPKCGMKMILVLHGFLRELRDNHPSLTWWCGCGHDEWVLPRELNAGAYNRRKRWEAVNR